MPLGDVRIRWKKRPVTKTVQYLMFVAAAVCACAALVSVFHIALASIPLFAGTAGCVAPTTTGNWILGMISSLVVGIAAPFATYGKRFTDHQIVSRDF